MFNPIGKQNYSQDQVYPEYTMKVAKSFQRIRRIDSELKDVILLCNISYNKVLLICVVGCGTIGLSV